VLRRFDSRGERRRRTIPAGVRGPEPWRCPQAVCVVMALALGAGTAAAQGTDVSVGASWSAPISFATSDASLTMPSGASYRLFTASTRVTGAPGVDVRIDRKLVRAVDAELLLGYSWPSLTSSLSTDAEGAAAVDASESLRELVIGGGALFHPSGWRLGNCIRIACSSKAAASFTSEAEQSFLLGRAAATGEPARLACVSTSRWPA
jgi:hypothetical protein